jgi:hypothetical protein
MTLNQVIQTISSLGESHKQVKTVFFGDTFDFLEQGDNNYPAMFFNIANGSISGNVMTFNVELFTLDKTLQDQTNVEDVKSDCIQIGGDILSALKYNQEVRLGDVSFDVVEEQTPDYLGGARFSFTFGVDFVYNECQIPN